MNEENMEEMMKKIEESAQDIVVPESLEPDRVKAKLQQIPQKKRFLRQKKAELAAAIALVVVVGGIGAYQHLPEQEALQMTDTEASAAKASDAAQQENRTKKETVGSYHLAKSYEDVYDSIAYVQEAEESGGILDKLEEKLEMASAEDDAAEGTADFSTTNTQVAGVDESDFIKNDGSYLYVQSTDSVSIIDIQGESMKKVATIEPELEASDLIADMYVDGDRLFLIVQRRDTALGEAASGRSNMSDVAYMYMDTSSRTELLTYDITGRKEGKLLGSVTVDGSYETSRKVGDTIYLFTSQYVGDRTEGDTDGIIPQVNGSDIASSCIYVQEDAYQEYIAVSVDVKKPDETVDQMVLMNGNMQIYMGLDAIYLYNDDYKNDTSYTDIAKFSYEDGYMDAVAATSVVGTIMDTFAISEEEGILRVLTTDWSKAQSENQLYLLDENLKLKGSLKNIAAGEEIYAARYIGTTAYFITYHNTDPLFAVDISDPAEPKLLGQIEMTGFSDYLHPFGENLLLGIGYETDPDTGNRLGVKLTMFDISDPVDLKIVDSVVVDGEYCEATSNYKCALVDADKNLIGFGVSDYSDHATKYMVYQWKNDHFSESMSEDMKDYNDEQIRGLYADDRFYLVAPEEDGYHIRSYNIEEKFKELDEIIALVL
jgi:uncharacterized secreted protein with C-terminal beta-propeller domain